MGLLKLFKYYLLEKDGRSLYVSNGTPSSGNQPRPVTNTPDGWQELIVNWERSSKYHGIQTNVTVPLGFVNEAALILRDAFLRSNIDRKIFLLIQKLGLFFDGANYDYRYDYYYKNEIDFTTIKDNGIQVDVNLINSGTEQQIKANENTEYEIELDQTVRMDGMILRETANYSVIDGLEIQKSVYGTNFFLPVFYVNKEGQSTGIAFLSQNIESVGGLSWGDKLLLENYILKAAEINTNNVDVNIKGVLKFDCLANDLPFGFRARFIRSNQSLPNQNDYEIFNLTPAPGSSHEFNVDITIPLEPGERLYFEGIYFGGTTGAIDINTEFLPDSNLKISFTNRHKATFVKGITARNLYGQLVKKITGKESNAVSTLLDQYPNLILISGNSLRGIENSVIRTKLSDFFDFADAQLFAGLHIQGKKVHLERRQTYFDFSDPIELGEVKDFEWTTANDMQYNRVKIGYPEDKAEDANGKYGFNNTHIYSTTIERSTRELSIICPYKADPFFIELNRLNLSEKDTTDNKADNDVFLLDVDAALPQETPPPNQFTFYNLKRVVYDSIEGVPFPETVFNIELTPKRMLKNHYPLLAAAFHGFESGNLKFETTDKNKDLKTTLGTEVIQESADIPISSMGAKLYLPILFEFTTRVPVNLVELMEENPNRCFSFIHEGNTYKGFNLNTGLAVNTNEEQKYQLLSTPDNNLTKLIK